MNNSILINFIEQDYDIVGGHQHDLIKHFVRATEGFERVMWVGKDTPDSMKIKSIAMINHFGAQKRLIEKAFLYMKLVSDGQKLFICSAYVEDLQALSLSMIEKIPPKTVFMYFHDVPSGNKQVETIRRIAQKYSNIEILCTTKKMVERFHSFGFKRVQFFPYPVTIELKLAKPEIIFRKLIHPGGLRLEKGMEAIVDLVLHLKKSNSGLPFTLQSGSRELRYFGETRKAFKKLDKIGYQHLVRLNRILKKEEYFENYAGAISVQPYINSRYLDRFSATFLESLAMGAPVIVTSNTYMAEVVERYQAGIVLEKSDPVSIMDKVDRIRADYGKYSESAVTAARELLQQYSQHGTHDLVNYMNNQ